MTAELLTLQPIKLESERIALILEGPDIKVDSH